MNEWINEQLCLLLRVCAQCIISTKYTIQRLTRKPSWIVSEGRILVQKRKKPQHVTHFIVFDQYTWTIPLKTTTTSEPACESAENNLKVKFPCASKDGSALLAVYTSPRTSQCLKLHPRSLSTREEFVTLGIKAYKVGKVIKSLLVVNHEEIYFKTILWYTHNFTTY